MLFQVVDEFYEKESEDRIQNSEYPMLEVRGFRKEFFLPHDSVALASPRASYNRGL